MKILVLGGSYFYGRVFVMLASRTGKERENAAGACAADAGRQAGTEDSFSYMEEEDNGGIEITVLNRGTYSMEDFGVRQVTGDRHDAQALNACKGDYDAVVDFCAYGAGDVEFVLEHLHGRIGQYILISTVDVYRRGTGDVKTEEAAFEYRQFPGEAGAYISGKVALEEEVRQACGQRKIPYTVLRPAILYGPYNYAPRESAYIQLMLVNHVLPRFTDADGRFQFVYVKDAAQAILNCMGNERAYGQAYNLCQDEATTYDSFLETLKQAAEPEVRESLQEIEMPVDVAMAQGVPVPFPASEEETELCGNQKSKDEIGMVYTDFGIGMQKTYRAFRNVWTK
ncbi:MAG: NAD-dependent epimerase/dehydratase family protein [Lachnospiraceae bacterium]|nr:NAD-dependent epimerase/dehydratase family protein [Lachnospiraceae bacterium]